MADQTCSLTCPICYEAYTATAEPFDRRPILVCRNGHTLCWACASSLDTCPSCREPVMLVPNRALLDVVAERLRQSSTVNDTGVPEISAEHVKLAAQPFAYGAYADVYDAVWQNQPVALKVLRRRVVTASELQDLLREAHLAMLLNHPNVLRVFGVVSIDTGKGLLMEKADRGSLGSALKSTEKLSLSQQVSISIDIVDGLDFIHSKQMIHRDLKPENVLLFDVKSQLTAKIADFGTSKFMQSSLTDTAMIGTPYYMAPELFRPQVRYGSQVDVYSLAIVLYEVFSGRNIRDAFPGIENPMQLLMCVANGQRPEMPKSFPTELRTVVERGWSADTNVRPTLADYREALRRLNASTPNANPVASASRSADADVYAILEEQLHKLQQSAKAYKLIDARSQVEVCRRLWMRLDDRTTPTSSTARFHSLKGYVHHWFGECYDAYAETYQALTELYELCVLGTSVEGEQLVTILLYAVEVFESQDQYAAAVLLVSYIVRYAKSKLSAAAYADALECFSYFQLYGEKWTKMAELVLSARLKASSNKPHINVATAHYYLAQQLSREHYYSDKNYSTPLDHLEKAQHVINEVDAGNIWAAVCKSIKGFINYRSTSDKRKLEEAKRCLEDALGIAERTLGKSNRTVSEIYSRLAYILEDMKRFGDAKLMYKKAIEAAENSLGPNSLLAASTMKCLADLCTNQLGRYQEAEVLYLRSIEISKNVFGPGNWRLSDLYYSLANTYTKWGQSDKAANYSRLNSERDSGKLKDNVESTFEELDELVDEVSRTLESGNEVSDAGELVDVLRSIFNVAPKPKPKPQLLEPNSITLVDKVIKSFIDFFRK